MKLVFVSSTFKDMQFERDMLHTHVIPLLDSKLTKYGESVRFGDLRWGVNTTKFSEEESSKKVLKVCLDQIDDCKPYMIVFIGERYGWIPSQDLIRNAAIFKGIDIIEDDISVTQLEIEYGALLNPDYEGRILFYFRELDKEGMTEDERKTYEAETSLHAKKIENLKNKIYQLYPNFVRTYIAKWNKEKRKVEQLEPLMNLIKEDLERIFTIDIEKYNTLDWQERAILASHEYFKEKDKVYVNTKTILTETKRKNESVFLWKNPNTLCSFEYYVGKEGTGKSTRVAHNYMMNYENTISKGSDNKIVIPFVHQIDEYTSSLGNLYFVIIYHLEKALGIKHKNFDFRNVNYDHPNELVIDYLVKLIQKIKKKNIFVKVVIDNIKINDIYGTFKKLEEKLIDYKKETAYTNIPLYFVIGLNEDYLPPNVPFFDVSESYPLGNLYHTEVKDIILNILKMSRKELSDEVIDHLLVKEKANDPYYLSLIINRLLMLDSQDFQKIRDLGDGMDAINKYMIMLVDNVGNNVKDITKEIIREIAERIDYDFVCKFLAITSYTNLWLKISEYEEIFRYARWDYNELNTSLLLNNLKFIFEKRDGGAEYKVTNKEVIKGIKEFIIENKYEYVLDILFDYIKQLPKNHDLKNYNLHFALATRDGKFIAKYYLNNVKIVKKPKQEHLEIYKSYSDFVNKLVKEQEYDVLLDFIKTLCIENASVNHYYLIAALTKSKLTATEYQEFVNFSVDLQTWLNQNKQITNSFTDAIFVWLQLLPCINLVQLESMISFERAFLIYSYCYMSKHKLPRELMAEAAIVLLRATIKRIDVDDNYESVKIFFNEMLDFSAQSLENVLFKDYYKTIMKGYIAKLISDIYLKVNDEDYKKYLNIYQKTLDKGYEKNIFINISLISQETYTIGYFHHAYLYINFDYEYDFRNIINYFYSDNLLPLLNDIDHCLLTADYNEYKKEEDVKNLLYRAYKKTLFLHNYYDGYKKKVFLVISKILEKLNEIEYSVLDEIPNVLEKLFNDVINDYHLSFEGGNDEFIVSAVMDNLEYFAYLVFQLYLFDKGYDNKKILINIFENINKSLEVQNPYINIIFYTLLYSFTDSNDEEDSAYIEGFESSYELFDKEDRIYKNYKKLINSCILFITGNSSMKKFGDYLYDIYSKKINIDGRVNY